MFLVRLDSLDHKVFNHHDPSPMRRATKQRSFYMFAMVHLNVFLREAEKAKSELPERLKGCDPKLVEMISNEVSMRAVISVSSH
jgi:hypothetical protein